MGILNIVNCVSTEDIGGIVYSVIFIICSILYWIPTFIFSSPTVFVTNLFCGWLCCIGWVFALILAIKGRSIPTMKVGVPTDYSQNQVDNYWNSNGNGW